jgi:hypothetical protein
MKDGIKERIAVAVMALGILLVLMFALASLP